MDSGTRAMKGRVLILTSANPDRPGGVEHFVRELVKGLEARSYEVEILHSQNSLPKWLKSLSGRVGSKIANSLLGVYIGLNAQRRMGDDVVAVISNSDVG